MTDKDITNYIKKIYLNSEQSKQDFINLVLDMKEFESFGYLIKPFKVKGKLISRPKIVYVFIEDRFYLDCVVDGISKSIEI